MNSVFCILILGLGICQAIRVTFSSGMSHRHTILAALTAMVLACAAFADRGDFTGDNREALKHGWVLNYQQGLD